MKKSFDFIIWSLPIVIIILIIYGYVAFLASFGLYVPPSNNDNKKEAEMIGLEVYGENDFFKGQIKFEEKNLFFVLTSNKNNDIRDFYDTSLSFKKQEGNIQASLKCFELNGDYLVFTNEGWQKFKEYDFHLLEEAGYQKIHALINGEFYSSFWLKWDVPTKQTIRA